MTLMVVVYVYYLGTKNWEGQLIFFYLCTCYIYTGISFIGAERHLVSSQG